MAERDVVTAAAHEAGVDSDDASDAGLVVAFDPGRNLGVAFVTLDGRLLKQQVVAPQEVAHLNLPPATVVVGDGTGHKELVAALARLGRRVELVPEEGTTLEGRELYFAANPPRGWQRLLPTGMRSPATEIDGYAAYAIALRWLRRNGQ